MKNLTSFLGRIIFAIPFLFSGISHFMHAKNMVGYVPAYMPGKIIWIYFTGVALILAAISIIIKKYAQLASFLLALFLILMILMIHIPSLSNPNMSQVAAISLLKDMALAGGALYICGTIK
jgi:uncharacterized membrane protein